MTEDPTASTSRMLLGIFEFIAMGLEEEGMPLTPDQRAFLVRAADRSQPSSQ